MNWILIERACSIRLQADMSEDFGQRRWIMRVIW